MPYNTKEIDLTEISHSVICVWLKDNKVEAPFQVFDTPNGNKLQSTLDAGVCNQIAIRAIGRSDQSTNNVYDVTFVNIDVVRDSKDITSLSDVKF